MIYNDYFGLNEEPFGVTPNPRFLYRSKCHEEAIAHIRYGIEQNRGFIMLTGEIGSGKTTLIRHILGDMDDAYSTAMILNPKMNALELLKFINQDFGLAVKRSATHKTLMDDLNTFLLDVAARDGSAVLVIDEAQELSPECLEFVRLLSNMETDTKKLLQVVLIGQPELRDIVAQPRLRQLDQRIAMRYHLRPLDVQETLMYVSHRLRIAGAVALRFPDSSIKKIHRFSGGIPRLINLAADRTLMKAFAEGSPSIKASAISAALIDLDQARGEGHGSSTKRPAVIWATVAATVIALIAVAVALSDGLGARIASAIGF